MKFVELWLHYKSLSTDSSWFEWAKRIRCWWEFVRKLKTLDDDDNALDANGKQYLFILIILEKIKETKLKCFQRRVTVLWNMANYKEARVKLTKNKTKITLRISKKNVEDEELPHELFLTTRQKN